MAKLELEFRGELDKLIRLPNIAKKMNQKDKEAIGRYAKEGFERDKSSRVDWESWYQEAMEAALQISRTKNFPWPNCSNVKFPLLTIAALNFHARAYPSLINSQQVVKQIVYGKKTQEKIERANRVGAHMSYQLMHTTEWEPETDRGLLILPILGCIFKKASYDPLNQRICSELISPEFLVVDYFSSHLDHCRRVSEMFSLHKNDILERVRSGRWVSVNTDLAPTIMPSGPVEDLKQTASKMQPPVTPEYYPMVSQNCWLDLDGDDYEEPYTVIFRQDTGHVARIVARWRPNNVLYNSRKTQVVSIKDFNCYTKIPFIPSPDGGFYELGFGKLLASLSGSIDTAINQLFDAGTMNMLKGGFLGRGARIKSGQNAFGPFEWKRVDSSGDDLRKNLVPLETGEPSKVMLDLLIFLINYAERVAGATESQVGENPGQNTPAETMRIMDQNGKLVYSAIFKRIWRAEGEEFAKIYDLNSFHPSARNYQGLDEQFGITEADYVDPPNGICSAADPNVISRNDKMQQSQLIGATASAMPGLHDQYAVVKRMYESAQVSDIDEILPPPGSANAPKPPPDPKLISAQADMLKAETDRSKEQRQAITETVTALAQVEKLMAQVRECDAKVLVLTEEAKTIQDDSQIALINTQIGAMKLHRETSLKAVDTITSLIESLKNEKSPKS